MARKNEPRYVLDWNSIDKWMESSNLTPSDLRKAARLSRATFDKAQNDDATQRTVEKLARVFDRNWLDLLKEDDNSNFTAFQATWLTLRQAADKLLEWEKLQDPELHLEVQVIDVNMAEGFDDFLRYLCKTMSSRMKISLLMLQAPWEDPAPDKANAMAPFRNEPWFQQVLVWCATENESLSQMTQKIALALACTKEHLAFEIRTYQKLPPELHGLKASKTDAHPSVLAFTRCHMEGQYFRDGTDRYRFFSSADPRATWHDKDAQWKAVWQDLWDGGEFRYKYPPL
jgi:hypothetical protein